MAYPAKKGGDVCPSSKICQTCSKSKYIPLTRRFQQEFTPFSLCLGMDMTRLYPILFQTFKLGEIGLAIYLCALYFDTQLSNSHIRIKYSYWMNPIYEGGGTCFSYNKWCSVLPEVVNLISISIVVYLLCLLICSLTG